LEHPLRTGSRLDNVSWDDLRLLLVCAEASSFREAARTLNVSSSTITRAVERVEETLGILLFNRIPEGIALTDVGREIVESVQAMQIAFYDLDRKRNSAEESAFGRVTIAVTEGIGSFWVMPRLAGFQRENPKIAVDLYCGMEGVDVHRLEADLSIQFVQPTNPDVIAQKIAKFHLWPFASQEYLDIYGMPQGYADLQHHKFVQQVTPELDTSAFAAYFRLENPEESIVMRTNTSTAHLYAIEKAAGIGGLPTFALALGANVVPIDIGSGYTLDVWMTWHAETRKSRHKAIALDWLKSIFDPREYPWFGDTLIHPAKLLELMRPAASVNVGRGFFAVDPPSPKTTKTKSRTGGPMIVSGNGERNR